MVNFTINQDYNCTPRRRSIYFYISGVWSLNDVHMSSKVNNEIPHTRVNSIGTSLHRQRLKWQSSVSPPFWIWSEENWVEDRDKERQKRLTNLSPWGLLTNANSHCFCTFESHVFVYWLPDSIVILCFKWHCNFLKRMAPLRNPLLKFLLLPNRTNSLLFLREGGCSTPPSPSKPLTRPYAYASYNRQLFLTPMASKNASYQPSEFPRPTYATV